MSRTLYLPQPNRFEAARFTRNPSTIDTYLRWEDCKIILYHQCWDAFTPVADNGCVVGISYSEDLHEDLTGRLGSLDLFRRTHMVWLITESALNKILQDSETELTIYTSRRDCPPVEM